MKSSLFREPLTFLRPVLLTPDTEVNAIKTNKMLNMQHTKRKKNHPKNATFEEHATSMETINVWQELLNHLTHSFRNVTLNLNKTKNTCIRGRGQPNPRKYF
ncbi:hypothetical protein JRQ81_010658 [Phrynocephalus forsythii]|uniref:Uncharacterized protein n=1 Tax=Phrynocephalus forsythii TaxID=171643 RepID=A0A9Q1AQS8_9SAUR|nr:hypothetical protein JRQ81_010658 [Phrynocephalus forsythii]